MSTKRRRDIYEATEKEYNTTDYRQKLCHQWLSYQEVEPAKLVSPTNLFKMDTPPVISQRTQKRKEQKTQADDLVQAKKMKRLDVPPFDDFWNDDDDFIAPRFDFENCSSEPKINTAKNRHSQSKQADKNNNRQLIDTNKKLNTFHSQSRANDSRQLMRKSNDQFDFDDEHFGTVDFRADYFGADEPSDDKFRKRKKDDFKITHDLIEFDENNRVIQQKHYDGPVERKSKPADDTSNHFRFRAYAELEHTTPMRQMREHCGKQDDDPFNELEWEDFGKTSHKRPFKPPHALERYDRYGREHRKIGKHQHDHQVALHELKAFEHPLVKANKAFQAFKSLTSASASGSVPIICNIKCNNLIIKTD